jgi:alkylhydroperoxidase family enzyme
MRKWIASRFLDRFSKRYDYDVSYLRALLEASPDAFFKFAPMSKLAAHREAAPRDAFYAAKLIGAMHEDCGPCVQIVVNMAREAQVSDAVIDAVLRRDLAAMGEEAAIAFRFADAVARRTADEDAAREAVRAAWGDKGVVDLTFAVQISRLAPMVKAGLGYAKECTRVTVGDKAVAVAKAA